jgi:hypothetical protein
MQFFKKIFNLPSPKKLGWSDDNALEMREFSDEPKGKTWEDYDEYCAEHYPIKYFFVKTLADFIRYNIWFKIKVPADKAWYWFVSHFVPSRRFHMLDLRQPCNKEDISNYDCYRYGWADVSTKMLYAIFNLLGEFLNKENVHDLTGFYSREEINNDEGLKAQQDAIDEARVIYNWWVVERREEQRHISNMLNTWCEAKKTKDPKKEEYWNTLNALEKDLEEKTDAMIARVMKIRRTLWS